jgi:hypothetical protein
VDKASPIHAYTPPGTAAKSVSKRQRPIEQAILAQRVWLLPRSGKSRARDVRYFAKQLIARLKAASFQEARPLAC